jgi:hypothetical protein
VDGITDKVQHDISALMRLLTQYRVLMLAAISYWTGGPRSSGSPIWEYSADFVPTSKLRAQSKHKKNPKQG